jgi:DNA-3-methyladenine glycosylase
MPLGSRELDDWAERFNDPLPRTFYDRSPRRVARDLLGSLIVHRLPEGYRVVRIVEVEAYTRLDPASHAYRGPTPRNRSMFAGPGTLYVYRIHQVFCANASTRLGEAVLLRAAEPVAPEGTNPKGPGRLCRVLGIDRAHDGASLLNSSVRILAREGPVGPVVIGPRVGIRKARARRLRYYVANSRWVSSPRARLPGAARG